MEAALCLGYGPMPSISLRIPSMTKLHFGFNPSSITVSSGFSNSRKCHHFRSTSGPLLALNRSNNSMPSANERGGGNKVVRGAVGASLALACALSIIGCSSKMNHFKAIAGPKQQIHRKAPPFQQIAPPPPRKMALKSLLDVTVSLASKDERKGREVTMVPPIPGRPSRYSPLSNEQIDQLKEAAVSLMKSGQPDQALFMLESECKKYEFSETETAYFMTMALVEILICQGKYEKAYEYLRKYDQGISDFDVRPTLYKAIVCTMLDKDDEAQPLWDEFATTPVAFSPYGF